MINTALMMTSTTPTVAGKQLSSSLKERLKRCGRYHSSPSPVTPVTKGGQFYASPSPVSMPPKVKQDTSLTLESSTTSPLCSNNKSSLVAKQPLGDLGSPEHNIRQQAAVTGTPVSKQPFSSLSPHCKLPAAKKLCTESPSLRKPPGKVCTSEDLSSRSAAFSTSRSTSLQRSTPLTARSKIKSKIIKGNKLDFSDKGVVDSLLKTGPGVEQTPQPTNSRQLSEHGVGMPQPSSTSTAMSDTVEKEIVKEIQDKEEKLRKLKMVKMYRSKNNLTELQALIDKWRDASQQALQHLHAGLPEPKPNLTQLVDHLGIEHKLIGYDSEEESFD